jgi:alpha-ketoglutarate-dependent sulfate ester dioxygenase
MSLLTINGLTSSVGAEVLGVDADRLTSDEPLGQAVLQALEDNGVLVFRALRLDPKTQVRFCRRLGEVDYSSDGHHAVPGIYPITLDRSKNSSAAYLRATFDWHIDGCTPIGNECPQKATLLSAVQVAERGGETEFANSYSAYEELTDEEKRRFGSLRVVHSLEASQRRITPNPHRRSCGAGGGGAPMSIRWYGLTVAAANRLSWAPRRTTSSAWTLVRAARC